MPSRGGTPIANSPPVNNSNHTRCHESRPFPAARSFYRGNKSIQIGNPFKFFGRSMRNSLSMAITLGAAFLCFALVLAHDLQDHSRLGPRNLAVYTLPSQANCEVTCEKTAKAISSKSQVFYPGELACSAFTGHHLLILWFQVPRSLDLTSLTGPIRAHKSPYAL